MSELRKEIGAIGIAAAMVNTVIGGGIYVLPAKVFGIAGNDSLYGYLLCGIIIFGIVLSFALLGSDINKSGGVAYFVYKSFGDFPGYIVNVLLWFGIGVLVNALFVDILISTLGLENFLYKVLFGLAVLTGIALLNIRGVKYGSNFVIVSTIIKLMPLFLIIIFGLPHIEWENLQHPQPINLKGVGEASIFLFFAFGGAEAALNFGEEIKNPGKNVFIGLFLGLAVILIIYLLLQIVCQGVVGNELANFKDAPLAEVGNRIFGSVAFSLIKAATFFSVFVALSGSILSYPRALYAGAESGWYPAMIKKLHPDYHSPYVAIIVYCIFVFILGISGQFNKLIILANGATLLIYIVVILAMLKQPFTHLTQGKSIAAKIIAGFSLISMVYLLFQMQKSEVIALALAILVFSAAYFTKNYFYNSPKIS